MSKENRYLAKPILKWAGGKTQLLDQIFERMPKEYERYLEPFIGGGAVFFALGPEVSIISDSNPELINLYKQIASNVDGVIQALSVFQNTKEDYYRVRALDWKALTAQEAAARTIFLNKTCFNGLFRVNRRGEFNVPYGAKSQVKFCDEQGLRKASQVLSKAEILCRDYHEVLLELTHPGDFIFLDPPYIPVSEYADFKRYTKEQFDIADQEKLASDVDVLVRRGCKVMITNSNHPVVHELYAKYHIEAFQTKRMISKDATKRSGEDVIITTYEF